MNKSSNLEKVIIKYNSKSKHIRDHVAIKQSYYENQLTYLYGTVPSSTNPKEDTYNIESSCVAKFLLTSPVFSELPIEESLILITVNESVISPLKQKQLLEHLYKNHNDVFNQYIQGYCYNLRNLKSIPFEILEQKDYIKSMNCILETLRSNSQLSFIDIQQQLNKIMNNSKFSKEQFLNDYPILKNAQNQINSFIDEQTSEVYNIKINLKKLFLVNCQKTFGYAKFKEVMETFMLNLENQATKVFHFKHIYYEYETVTEEGVHNMNIIFCAPTINKKLLGEVIQLHLDAILKESKFDLAKEKTNFNFALYEKAKIESEMNSSSEPEVKKVKRKI